MASHGALALPVDYFFDTNLPNTWLVTDTRSSVRRDVLGLFNFYGTPLKIGHSAARIGLDPENTYHAFDFWENKLLPDLKGLYQDEIPANSCRIVALREAMGHPVLLSTSRHVSQGIIDVTAEKWSADTLSGTSQLIANDPCELRIRVPDGWNFDRTSHGNAVTKSGLVRVMLERDSNGPVDWSIRFSRARCPPGPSGHRDVMSSCKIVLSSSSGLATVSSIRVTIVQEKVKILL
jgi:hypothetical protein